MSKNKQNIDRNENIKQEKFQNCEINEKQIISGNNYLNSKNNIIENGNSKEKNENSDYKYNNISQYSDISDRDYLNNESKNYNSNKREENRENIYQNVENFHNGKDLFINNPPTIFIIFFITYI